MQLLRKFSTFIGLAALLTMAGACSSSSDTTGPATTPTTIAPPITTTIVDTTTVPDTTVPAATQPAIWPAADVVFTTPEAAATDFLAAVFGEGPVIGEFMAGDSRSGEFEVFATADGAVIGEARSVLFMRQLGASDGWFVLAAGSDTATITEPASMATVPAAPLEVSGAGSGYEATLNVSAFVAGDAAHLDEQIVMAGNFGELLPYTTTVDLSTAASGDIVVLLTIGTTGLETDPGTFSAIPVVIA
ncbi:MAG: hypothetical protein ABMA25_08555 [Ilumatobacteraceae bacterium]